MLLFNLCKYTNLTRKYENKTLLFYDFFKLKSTLKLNNIKGFGIFKYEIIDNRKSEIQ